MNIIKASPYDPEAVQLIRELSDCLEDITGDSGNSSFNIDDVNSDRALFVIAYSKAGNAIGCGCIRPMEDKVAEIKRVYVRARNQGVGTQIINYLEEQAKELDFLSIRLETRLINENAVRFYENRGFKRIANYGKYKDRPECVCFEKWL